MGIPLNHHLLSKSQELFRMETVFPKEAKFLVLMSGGGDGGLCVCDDGDNDDLLSSKCYVWVWHVPTKLYTFNEY